MHDLGKIKKYNISVNDKMFFFFWLVLGLKILWTRSFYFLFYNNLMFLLIDYS